MYLPLCDSESNSKNLVRLYFAMSIRQMKHIKLGICGIIRQIPRVNEADLFVGST
jgi:hypothetical protein